MHSARLTHTYGYLHLRMLACCSRGAHLCCCCRRRRLLLPRTHIILVQDLLLRWQVGKSLPERSLLLVCPLRHGHLHCLPLRLHLHRHLLLLRILCHTSNSLWSSLVG